MKITFELTPLELSGAMKDGTLSALLEHASVAERAGKAIAQERVSKEDKPKKDTKKTQKPDPKEEPKEETAADEPEKTTETGSDSEVSLEEVRAKLAELMKKGKKAEVADLLSEFDAQKLTDVEESDYAALLEKAKAI